MRIVLISVLDSFVLSSVACAEDILPLKHGYYVSNGTECAKASNATLNLYNGDHVGGAHMDCGKAKSHQVDATTYKVTTPCRDMQGGSSPVLMEDTYTVASDHEYSVTNQYGSFKSRYCPQSQLPEPWHSNSIGK